MEVKTHQIKLSNNGIAVVWQDPDDAKRHFITTTRGTHRGTESLEAQTWDAAIKEAQEYLK